LNQIKWKEEWGFCAKIEMDSNLFIRGEHPVLLVIIEDHQHFLIDNERTKKTRQSQRLDITSFEEIKNATFSSLSEVN
jgi:hypothetical protein